MAALYCRARLIQFAEGVAWPLPWVSRQVSEIWASRISAVTQIPQAADMGRMAMYRISLRQNMAAYGGDLLEAPAGPAVSPPPRSAYEFCNAARIYIFIIRGARRPGCIPP